jgi:hypothetical protein
MAQLANTHDRYDLDTTGVNVVPDVSDIISNISPTETPLISNIGKDTATSTLKEWLKDSLAAPDAANKHIDGDEFTNEALDSAERLGNYCQISWKVLEVTRRAEKVKKYGRKSELAYQIAKKGKELKNDLEYIMVGGGGHQAAAAGSSSVAPTTASLGSWLATNTSRGAGGADPTLSSTTYGYPNAAPTDGTDRALSEATLLGIIKDCYVEGGNPNTIMVGPVLKQKISQYMFSASARIATPYQEHGAKTKSGISVVGSVDVYVSDFGALDIVPNRRQREDDCWVLDLEYWDVAYLDPYHVGDIAKTGDAMRKSLIVDYCLVSKNEAASGVVADIDETLAMVA